MSNMVNRGRLGRKGFHWNHNVSNGFVIAVILFIMSGTIVSCAEPTEANNNSITINCSELKTCKMCAYQESCLWSLERQACYADYGLPLMLIARTDADCPEVSLTTKVTYAAHLPYVYQVKVDNDVTGFVEFLNQTQVWCIMLDITLPATVVGDTISCAPVDKSALGFDHQTLMTYHCYVIFGDGDTILRLDDGADSYFTVYDEYFYGYRMDESCVSCLWDVGQYAYYYKWCASRNTATGRYMFYVGYSDTDHNAVMPVDDRALAKVPASSGCNDLRVQFVEPLSALWTGGVRVKVTIANHAILADGGSDVKVTVAGRECVRPTTMDRGAGITCLLTAANRRDEVEADREGPVLVTYRPSSLTVESAQTFRLLYPEITDVSPSCGSLAGGTLLAVRGRHLDAGSHVTVAVQAPQSSGEPSSVPCEIVSRNNDRILCMTGPSKGPATGHVTAVFDKALRLQSGAFTYTAGPVLAAGLKFEGIASGGTAVTVRGTGFDCVGKATMYADRDGVRRVASGHCHPVNDTRMICSTPKLDGPAAGALPERLHFGFRVQLVDGHVSDVPPPPDTDGYVAHADPVLDDFSVSPNGRSVLVRGLDLGRGYRAADVSVVRFSRNLTTVACNVTAVIPRHIACESDSPAGLNGVSALVVTVGDQFAHTVHRGMDVRQHLSFVQFFIAMFFVSGAVAFSHFVLKSYYIVRLVADTV